MFSLMLVVLYGLFFYGYYRYRKRKRKNNAKLDLIQFDQEMEDLQMRRKRIMTLQQLMIDIDVCSEKQELYKVFNISWNNAATGEDMNYDLYIYDSKDVSAELFKRLAEVEVEEMTPDIQTRIERLKFRSQLSKDKK